MGALVQLKDEDVTTWDKVKQDFLSKTVLNTFQIAKRHRVNRDELLKRAEQNKWMEARQDYQSNELNQLMERLKERPSQGSEENYKLAVDVRQRVADYMQKNEGIAMTGLEKIMKVLSEAEKLRSEARKQLSI